MLGGLLKIQSLTQLFLLDSRVFIIISNIFQNQIYSMFSCTSFLLNIVNYYYKHLTFSELNLLSSLTAVSQNVLRY